MKFELNQFGFEWGPAEVTRIHSDIKYGVVIEVKSARGNVQVRVTPSGLIRVTEMRKFLSEIEGRRAAE